MGDIESISYGSALIDSANGQQSEAVDSRLQFFPYRTARNDKEAAHQSVRRSVYGNPPLICFIVHFFIWCRTPWYRTRSVFVGLSRGNPK